MYGPAVEILSDWLSCCVSYVLCINTRSSELGATYLLRDKHLNFDIIELTTAILVCYTRFFARASSRIPTFGNLC